MQSAFYCATCKSGPMSTRQQYDQHCRGKNHLKKMSMNGCCMQTDLPDDCRSTVFYSGDVVERAPIVINSDSDDEYGGSSAAKQLNTTSENDFPSLGLRGPAPPTKAMAGLSLGRGRGRASNRSPTKPPSPAQAPKPNMSWSKVAQVTGTPANVAAPPTASLPQASSSGELRPLTQSERSGNVRLVRHAEAPVLNSSSGNRPMAKNPKFETAKRIYGEFSRNRKTASQAIQEIATTLQWRLEEEEVVPERGNFMNFAMRWKINGVPCEKGQGQKKKLAKEDASRLALKKHARLIESMGEIDPDEIEATVRPSDSDSKRLTRRNQVDDYKALTMSKVEDIFREARGSLERPVRFAAFFVTTQLDQPAAEGQMVALGTGRCVTKLTVDEAQEACGYRLHDMQAAVIARRSLQAYLYGQLSQALTPAETNRGLSKYGQTILEYSEQTTRFCLKPGVRFHLYMSHAPAGDATAFDDAFAKDQDLTEAELKRDLSGLVRPTPADPTKGLGRLRVVVDPYRDETAILTDSKTERIPGQKTVLGESLNQHGDQKISIMSLADKVMKWVHVGLQGSLLSLLLDPVFLYSIQMGSGYAHEHASRAFLARVPVSMFPTMPQSYSNADDPFLGRSTQVAKLRSQIESPVSLNWYCGASAVEKVNCDEGGINVNECSRVCRINMLQRLEQRWTQCLEDGNVKCAGLFRRLRPFLKTSIKSTRYGELKSFADEYQRAKSTLYKTLVNNKLGRWRQKENLQDFCLEDYDEE